MTPRPGCARLVPSGILSWVGAAATALPAPGKALAGERLTERISRVRFDVVVACPPAPARRVWIPIIPRRC